MFGITAFEMIFLVLCLVQLFVLTTSQDASGSETIKNEAPGHYATLLNDIIMKNEYRYNALNNLVKLQETRPTFWSLRTDFREREDSKEAYDSEVNTEEPYEDKAVIILIVLDKMPTLITVDDSRDKNLDSHWSLYEVREPFQHEYVLQDDDDSIAERDDHFQPKSVEVTKVNTETESNNAKLEEVTRKSWLNAYIKKVYKYCRKACRRAFKDACTRRGCRKRIRKRYKKECKSSCGAKFDRNKIYTDTE